jgi:hypothetical protein
MRFGVSTWGRERKKMKTKKLKRAGQTAWRLGLMPGALVLASLALAACGGGGATGAAGSNPSLSGKVIDGYIEGAEVCLDLNANLACDTNEPSATTAKDGTYTLNTTGLSTDQIKAAHLLTVVPETAKDADDNGQTLKEAGKSAFSLLAPAAAYVGTEAAVTGAVISPLTTLVAHDMITSQTTLATAETNVRSRLSLADSADLRQDFVAKKDASLSEKAQMLTVALGSVKAQALADTTTQPSDKQALLAALQYLQTQVTQLQAAFDEAKKANATAKPVDLVKAALATETAKPAVIDLVAEAKKTTDSSAVSSVTALIEQGFYGAQHVLENCGGSCTPSYWKIQGNGGKILQDQDYSLSNGNWVKNPNDGNTVLTPKGWVSETTCAVTDSTTYSVGSDGVTTVTFCSGATERVTARSVDAAAKTLKDLGLNPPLAFESMTLPAGSLLYWLDFANKEDKYDLYTGNPVTYWTSTGQVKFSSLEAYISTYATASNGTANYAGWSGLHYSFNAGGTATGGTVSLWSPSWDATKNQSVTPKVIGQASYSINTVYGQKVLIIHAVAPENKQGQKVMFAVKDGVLYGGSFRAASAKSSSEALFNKTMLNAILAAGKLPSVLD